MKKTMLHKKLAVALAGLIILASIAISCNKKLEKPVPIPQPAQPLTPTLADLLNASEFSIFKAAATRVGLIKDLANPKLRFTVFAPNDAAIAASGLSATTINAMPLSNLAGLVGYHIVPQILPADSIPTKFPNLQYPTIINPAPSLSALLRLTTFPSKRGTATWVNNVPVTSPNNMAVNGVLHKVPVVVAPPSADLWSRINSDPNLTYLKATITRADSAVAPGSRLQDALNTSTSAAAIAANLTIFAPTDAAMKAFLTGALTQAFMANSIPPAQAQAAATALVSNSGSLLISNPASIPDLPGLPPGIGKMIADVITPTLAKGIVVYHILSSQSGNYAPPGVRVFSVNFPTTATVIKTLLNSAVAKPEGITVKATFGASGVTAITVKGDKNATAANVLINPLPGGTSDQHYVNGVIHEIDQVLIPQ